MISHTEYINRLNELIKLHKDAVANEMAVSANRSPKAEVDAAMEIVRDTFMAVTSMMAEKVDPATKRKVAMNEDYFFIFVD